jgi:hypothetical protein
MSLFTDGTITSTEELTGHDTQLLAVANVEGIDVSRKLVLAQEEISVEVAGLLGRHAAPPALEQVVVTPAIKLWHAYRTLELVYRDAYHSQLNDRYAGKRDEYRTLAHWAYNHVIQSGLGIAAEPIGRATPPELTLSAGNLDDGTYYVSVAWTNGAGEEGACSSPGEIRTSNSSFAARTAAAGRRGWNVYCGTGPEAMTLQNTAPLAPNETWIQPVLSSDGRAASKGQEPTYRLAVPRILQRG